MEDAAEDNINPDISALRDSWIAESTSPEILEFKEEVFHDVSALVSHQEQLIEDLSDNPDEAFSITLYQMEVDRVKFSLARYLRARLRKIEDHALHILGKPELMSRLSEAEVKFAESYVDLLGEHFRACVLADLPKSFQDFPDNLSAAAHRPNLDTYVFCRITEELGDVQLDDSAGESARTPLHKGDLQVLRYLPIEAFVGNQIKLI